jgi:hypothetical protein
MSRFKVSVRSGRIEDWLDMPTGAAYTDFVFAPKIPPGGIGEVGKEEDLSGRR